MIDLIKTRRYFHQFPEIGFEEIKTTREIIKILENMNCKFFYGRNIYKDAGYTDDKNILESDLESGKTGVLAVVGDGPYIFVRADIDGLPVSESKSKEHIPFKEGFSSSKNMHACGHDGHITLGLAIVEYFIKNNISGKVLFQPAEEGVLGAISMDLDFILSECKSAIGFHIGLGQEKGTIGVGSTNFMASVKMDVEFSGRSAHACNSPQIGASAFNMAIAFNALATELQNDSRGRKVFNVGQIHGGEADNIVMKNCTLGIDMRATQSYLLDEMIKNVERIAISVASARDGSFKMKLKGRAESYIEDDFKLVDEISDDLNKNNINTTKLPDFGASEDVTTYLNYVKAHGGKGIHLLLGADLKGPHHSDCFDFDDKELEFYIKALKIVAGKMLTEN